MLREEGHFHAPADYQRSRFLSIGSHFHHTPTPKAVPAGIIMHSVMITIVRSQTITRRTVVRTLARHSRSNITAFSGPDAVHRNLCAGLSAIGEPFTDRSSRFPSRFSGNVGLLSGQKNINKLAQARQDGQIHQLIVGPNVATLPSELPSIALIHADLFVTPSPWVAELYRRDCALIADKIAVWPVGVDTDWWTPVNTEKSERVLIYVKNCPREWLSRTIAAFEVIGATYKIIEYGKHDAHQFREALRMAPAMISLSPSESQGIALLEAWSVDTPTFCASSDLWRSSAPSYLRESSSAPFLNDESGAFFNIDGNLKSDLPDLLNNLHRFTPRAYAEAKFSLAMTATNYAHFFRKNG